MRKITISVFGDGEPDPVYETIPDEGVCGIQVSDDDGQVEPDYYDFRLQAPVLEHLLGEVTQLVDDLLSHHVAGTVALQPQLF